MSIKALRSETTSKYLFIIVAAIFGRSRKNRVISESARAHLYNRKPCFHSSPYLHTHLAKKRIHYHYYFLSTLLYELVNIKF